MLRWTQTPHSLLRRTTTLCLHPCALPNSGDLSSSPGQADAISEWIKLAQLVLVQVHGSSEDERMFSAMSYLKNKYRNKLDEPHLNEVARFFHQQWCNYKSFPYNASLDIWHARAPRRDRYGRAGG